MKLNFDLWEIIAIPVTLYPELLSSPFVLRMKGKVHSLCAFLAGYRTDEEWNMAFLLNNSIDACG